MEWWMVGAFANAVVGGSYFAIAYLVLLGPGGVLRDEQWRTNYLALATGAIFFSCAVGHGLHLSHLLEPGVFGVAENAARESWDWHLAVWDLVTATIAIIYFNMRSRFGVLVQGSALFEDLTERRRQALEIHDNVVQGIASAKLAIEMDHTERGLEILDGTLAEARAIISGLLVDSDDDDDAIVRTHAHGSSSES